MSEPVYDTEFEKRLELELRRRLLQSVAGLNEALKVSKAVRESIKKELTREVKS